ncbi:hypothetical protein D3OALGA1CA_3650 [Olavius algarvensis associated proteobacterium Delta 3]|nr:hypothetical protein D3OALGA1CA_3650 [Olavius algarvensis associated proteobacterium Delta 3]CAB5147742.1 hypothetical protein D3OALGB2SA_4612 [Olavius algarvensis associated proteobacterium Delta 3]
MSVTYRNNFVATDAKHKYHKRNVNRHSTQRSVFCFDVWNVAAVERCGVIGIGIGFGIGIDLDVGHSVLIPISYPFKLFLKRYHAMFGLDR